jgi:DNA-binding response OmpR family regulator
MSEDNVRARPRALVASADPQLRTDLLGHLRRAGFEVIMCRHGLELAWKLEAIGSDGGAPRLDVLVCEARMPGVTGLEVLEDVRVQSAALPVVLLVARNDQTSRRRGEALGASAIVEKPFDMGEVVTLLQRLCTEERVNE